MPLGIPLTRFQTPAGIQKWNGTGAARSRCNPSIDPAHPSMQVGDFTFSVVDGAIDPYFPRASQTPAEAYLDGVERLLSGRPPPRRRRSGTSRAPSRCWATTPCRGATWPTWAATTTRRRWIPGRTPRPDGASKGQTAGTRIVLNTLFNLGFGCADPGTTCQTGGFGACATGTLRCASGGGYQCVGAAPAAKDLCQGQDDNCNGVIDDDCNPPACTPGETRACYSGPEGTQAVGTCRAGTQTCTGGFWGACAGQVAPTPEVCNGLDDDCSGAADDGTLCGSGYACTAGTCLPTSCNSENARCPAGFDCDPASHTCAPVPCGTSGTACGVGRVCRGGACVDPCQGITCGQGSSCSGGQCVAGGCSIAGCPNQGEVCLQGSCVADPCAGAACPTGTFCRAGDCVRSCAVVECARGQTCGEDGFCDAPCSPTCEAGQVCVLGACQPDTCASVSCGASQVCRNGACVDPPCNHVSCPVGSCQDGQCVVAASTASGSGSGQAPSAPGSGSGQALTISGAGSSASASVPGGGCGTGGAGGLLSLALAAAVLARRRLRGLAPALAAVQASAAVRWVALLAVAVLGTAGLACGSKGSSAQPLTCEGTLTACSEGCVDLETSASSCGTCGRACPAGYDCLGRGCSLDTGNPYVQSIAPASAGRDQTSLSVKGAGFRPGARVRLSGGGLAEVTLDAEPSTLTATSLELRGLDLAAATVGGTVEVRVLNPNPTEGGGPLVSNYARLAVTDKLLLRGVSPQASVKQDAAALDLELAGAGFVSGLSATLSGPAGSTARVTLALPTTFVDAGRATVFGLAPATLAIGSYDLTVTNPGGVTSGALKLTVTEGTPGLTIVQACASQSQTDFTVTGTNLYPSSVAHVAGGAIVDSVLETSCLTGTDALGRCQGGQVRVSVDLSTTPPGNYAVWMVNPGSPSPQATARRDIQVVAGVCP